MIVAVTAVFVVGVIVAVFIVVAVNAVILYVYSFYYCFCIIYSIKNIDSKMLIKYKKITIEYLNQ